MQVNLDLCFLKGLEVCGGGRGGADAAGAAASRPWGIWGLPADLLEVHKRQRRPPQPPAAQPSSATLPTSIPAQLPPPSPQACSGRGRGKTWRRRHLQRSGDEGPWRGASRGRGGTGPARWSCGKPPAWLTVSPISAKQHGMLSVSPRGLWCCQTHFTVWAPPPAPAPRQRTCHINQSQPAPRSLQLGSQSPPYLQSSMECSA